MPWMRLKSVLQYAEQEHCCVTITGFLPTPAGDKFSRGELPSAGCRSSLMLFEGGSTLTVPQVPKRQRHGAGMAEGQQPAGTLVAGR